MRPPCQDGKARWRLGAQPCLERAGGNAQSARGRRRHLAGGRGPRDPLQAFQKLQSGPSCIIPCASCALQVHLLQKDIQRAQANAIDDEAAAAVGRAKTVVEGHGAGGDLRKLCKQKTPALLRMLLGSKVNVVTLQVEVLTSMLCTTGSVSAISMWKN